MDSKALGNYMSESIGRLMRGAYASVLSNPREALFVSRMAALFRRSERTRLKVGEREGIDVPPFLIASIATACNLSCKGCYAREGGIVGRDTTSTRPLLSAEQWQAVFREAASMGINFALLAGGEPLMRHDLIAAIAEVKDMLFPVFTNGTLIGPSWLSFFEQHLNVVPVVSLEGLQQATDDRRGAGVYERAMMSVNELGKRDLFFGTSITVTTANMQFVTSSDFLEGLSRAGCRLVFFVEYVPFDAGTEHLALKPEDSQLMEQLVEDCRVRHEGMLFLSFPGDEQALGGCLASGRGFFHIGPDGAAEPCPFSPYSDSNVATMGVAGALRSPLFRRLRDLRALGWEHTGGCTLFEHREEVERLLAEGSAEQ